MKLVKKTREVGTSAGVLLPRSWLNKEVVVTLLHPSKEKILTNIIQYLIDNKLSEDIKGIYLYGSHARNEAQPESDIDVLVITQKTNKLIKQNNYEILIVSEENFAKNLSQSLAYLSFLQEAQALLNKELLNQYKQKNIKVNLGKQIKEIKSIMKINEEAINTCKNYNRKIPMGIVYSIILRLRELYLIKCLKSKKEYSNKDFLNFITEKVYSIYLKVKRNEKNQKSTTPDELINLISLSKKWLKEVKD